MKTLNRLFVILILSSLAFSQPSQNPILSSYWVPSTSDSVMRQISDHFEIKRKMNGGYEVFVPVTQTATLLSIAPEAQLIEWDIDHSIRNKTARELSGYHDFATVQSHLQTYLKNYPQITSLEQYGSSMEKRPLLALKITSSVTSSNKPAILLTSSTHGNELITVEVLFGLMENLLSNYGKDERITRLVDHYQIYFIPVVNPDGYFRRERYANGIDPNRDYPMPESADHRSNPCVSAIMDFYASHSIVASMDYHSSGEMIMYPWAYTYNSLPSFEKNFFDEVTTRMASFNGYAHGQISKVIYVAKGSSADYYHWKHKAWALGIEVARTNVPSANEIPKIVKENTESTWTFIESIH